MRVGVISRIAPLLALAGALTAGGVLAQQARTKAGKATGAGMADQCKQMMAMHDRMMADMKAMDAALDQKVAVMNAARGNAKVDAMAAVISEMASQRKQMMAKMSGMRDQMMAHMGSHMAQTGGAAAKSMAQCPMMKGTSQ